MATVDFRHVHKLFGQTRIIDDLNLHINDGEFLVLVGPSGCGKTTTLRMLAGLERPTYGSISIDDRDVTTVAPKDRDIAMVFQSYALYPHLTVFDNLAFGMKIRRVKKEEIKTAVEGVAETLNLTSYLQRRPAQLSGGQRQRVALGRAMLRKPKVFLLDEPLSNLDAALRGTMRAELSRIQATLGVTAVYVTHDQIEAMTMGTRVVVMKDGYIQQSGPPEAVYGQPANAFVARFIGAPKINLLNAMRTTGGLKVAGTDALIGFPADLSQDVGGRSSDHLLLGLRPEDVAFAPFAPRTYTSHMKGQVEVIEPLGGETYVTTRVDGELVVARFPARTNVRLGETVELAINVDHLCLFDAENGRNLRCPDAPASPPADSARDLVNTADQ